MTQKVSNFICRGIPAVGWVILAKDVSQITFNTVTKYHSIARGADKIW